MVRQRRNGVDAAIALLSALAGGEQSFAALAQRTATPRSSLHRIARILAAEGVIEHTHGRLRPGGATMGYLAINATRVGQRDRLKEDILRQLERSPLWNAAIDPELPLPLSPPSLLRRKGRFRIGFSNAAMDNPWRTALVHSIEYAAAHLREQMGWLTVRHADNDADKQAGDIEALVREGIDGLLVSALASPVVHEAIDWASAQGVPVVLVDRGVPADIGRCSFVTSDDAFIGHVTALWLAETLGGRGSIILLPGLEGAGPAIKRLEAAQSVFATFPEIHVRGVVWTGWKRDRAYEIMTDRLSGPDPGLDGVWCDSGLQSIGSLQAFIDAGYAPGTVPPHTGGDLNGAYKLALRHKVKLAAVDYPPAMGVMALDVLLSSLSGFWVPQTVVIPSDVIVTRSASTLSVQASLTAENHVHWDLPDDLILSAGLGPAYDPGAFRVHYPGNIYNRSAARMCA